MATQHDAHDVEAVSMRCQKKKAIPRCFIQVFPGTGEGEILEVEERLAGYGGVKMLVEGSVGVLPFLRMSGEGTAVKLRSLRRLEFRPRKGGEVY